METAILRVGFVASLLIFVNIYPNYVQILVFDWIIKCSFHVLQRVYSMQIRTIVTLGYELCVHGRMVIDDFFPS